MGNWNNEPSGGAADWHSGNDGGWNDNAGGADGYNNGEDHGYGAEGADGGNADAGGDTCRNCGQDGHFARDCPEPRKMGACFNCGQEGHSKMDCPNPRVFKGACRTCNEEGHPAAECPQRVIVCRNCKEEGHETLLCENLMKLDLSKVPDKTEDEAWALLTQASEERDIGDFKEAVQILSKVNPTLTYPELEKEFRNRDFNVYLIAMEKDHGDTLTVANLQGVIGKKFVVGYYYSEKVQRPLLKERWPKDAAENLERLAEAGVPMDRGIPKCANCEQLGHTARGCKEERRDYDQAGVKCALCGEDGHRVRDCKEERRKAREPRTCKVCESEDHIARDCPNREKRTCRNCDSEDHVAKECDQPPDPARIQCRNCDAMGHSSRDCPAPRDYSRVTCRRCGEKGHTEFRCKQPAPEENEGGEDGNGGDGFGNEGGYEDHTATPAVTAGGW